jgi:hypothetical protein
MLAPLDSVPTPLDLVQVLGRHLTHLNIESGNGKLWEWSKALVLHDFQ